MDLQRWPSRFVGVENLVFLKWRILDFWIGFLSFNFLSYGWCTERGSWTGEKLEGRKREGVGQEKGKQREEREGLGREKEKGRERTPYSP